MERILHLYKVTHAAPTPDISLARLNRKRRKQEMVFTPLQLNQEHWYIAEVRMRRR